MDEEHENQIEDHKQQLKLKIINSSDWIGHNNNNNDDHNQIDQVHHQEINTPPPPPLTRICEFCGKGFSSGKALGGHKRYHIQEARKFGVFIPTKSMKLKLKKHKLIHNMKDDDNEVHGSSSVLSPSKEEEKEKSICCLCQKEFPSKKSLFGHMRSHRDRDWRGIQPPPMITSDRISRSSSCSPPAAAAEIDNDSGTSLEMAAATDQSRVLTFEPVEVLGTWCKKRSRNSSIGGDLVAAGRLVSLSDLVGEQQQQQRSSSLIEEKKIIGSKKGYDSDDDDSYWLREDQELKLHDHDDLDKKQCSLSLNKNTIVDYDDYDVVSNKRKKEKEKERFSWEKRPRKSELMEENIKIRKKPKTSFKCSSCGKSFPTFQALGGHRSSHNKDKHMTALPEDSTGAAAAGAKEKLGVTAAAGKSSSSQVDDQEASESSQTGPRKVLDFDLNEAYVVDQEDDFDEQAA